MKHLGIASILILGIAMIAILAFPFLWRPRTPAEFLAHEIARQWLGNALRIDLSARSTPWLSEGFATYADALFIERRDGPSALRRHLQTFSRFYYKRLLAFQDWPVLKVRHDNRIYRPVTYEKGAWTLHSRRWVMGDEAFFGAMRDF